ncbi:MAG: ABC transporter substrate-binding protein [Sphaerochaetaceae bacterium]|nr:ABC transporter substrate-binding protein [Sphaerochaetaceae bacterium]
MKRKVFATVLMCFVLFSVFAKGTSESSDQKVIRICQFKVEIADDLQKLAEEYEELTGVKVEVESLSSTNYQSTLRAKQAAGELPDIFNNEGYTQLVEWSEYLDDLSGESWVKDMSASTVSGATIDGKIHALPLYLEGYGLCYNKDLFAKAGITQIPGTLSELEEACGKLEQAGFTAFGLPFGGNYNPGLFMFNVAIAHQPDVDKFIADATAGKADFVNNEIMQDWADFLDMTLRHCLGNPLELDFPSQMSTFALEDVAITLANNGAWLSFVGMNENIKPDYMAVPINENREFNDVLYAGPSTYWVVNKNSAVKEEAKDFLEWLVTSDRGKYYLTDVFNFIPGLTSISVSDQADPLSRAVSEAVANDKALGWEWPKYPSGAQFACGDAIIEYAAGRLTRTELLKKFENIFVSYAAEK